MTTDKIQYMVDSVNMIVAMAKSSFRDRDWIPFFLWFPVNNSVLEKSKVKNRKRQWCIACRRRGILTS
jgi:hypothetical protein